MDRQAGPAWGRFVVSRSSAIADRDRPAYPDCVARGPVPAETAGELKERIDAERRGAPFLVYRDEKERQLI